jgi:hypothetical protein
VADTKDGRRETILALPVVILSVLARPVAGKVLVLQQQSSAGSLVPSQPTAPKALL